MYNDKSIYSDGYELTDIFSIPDISDINPDYIKRYALSGESALEVSYILYGSSEYYWTLYLLNDVVNPYEDWYMSPTQLRLYSAHKYDNPEHPHDFYYISTKKPLNYKQTSDMWYLYNNSMSLPHDVTFNTNFQYEARMNENKKVIHAITESNILEFVNIYDERLRKL